MQDKRGIIAFIATYLTFTAHASDKSFFLLLPDLHLLFVQAFSTPTVKVFSSFAKSEIGFGKRLCFLALGTLSSFHSTSGRTRTYDNVIRNHGLYPTELRTHLADLRGLEPLIPAPKAGVLPITPQVYMTKTTACRCLRRNNIVFVGNEWVNTHSLNSDPIRI